MPKSMAGDHVAELRCEGTFNASTQVDVRVCAEDYWTIDQPRHLFARDGKPAGPLSGSFQGSFYFKDVGLPSERQINGQAQWDSWDRSTAPGERMHWWEALTAAEFDKRFAYLARCGWDAVYLHQHWGFWERLDAGGNIAPHGAEQLALYTRRAARHGIATVQALSSYPYTAEPPDKTAPPRPDEGGGTTDGTITYGSYLDAGFTNRDWFHPADRPFDRMFHEYLRQFVLLFSQETNLLAMTASGEGDKWNGLARSNDIFHFIRERDPRHLFLAEPIHQMKRQPTEDLKGWDQDMKSGRIYWIGEALNPETDLGIEFKIYQRWGLYLAEGNWPAPNPYSHVNALAKTYYAKDVSWVGTPRYRTRIRDTFYLGLVHRIPLMMTWDERISEDEHEVLRQARQYVDWTQQWSPASVFVRIDDSNILSTSAGRQTLARYEAFFSAAGLAYAILSEDEPAPSGALAVFDARRDFVEPRWGETLPEALRTAMPLAATAGYAQNHSWSADRRTLLAYLYNVSGHSTEAQALTGKFHRNPRPVPLSLSLVHLPVGELRYRLFDLNTRKLHREGVVHGSATMDVGVTEHDFLLLVNPG